MPDLPTYGVAPSQMFKGVTNKDDTDTPHLTLASFDEAFEMRWESDAHFITYTPVGEVPDNATFPRCNKVVLHQLRGEGIDLMRHTFALDWDTPEHKEWGITCTREEFIETFMAVCEKFPLAANYSCIYFTKKGARIVYTLDELIPVDRSEKHLRWFIYKLRTHGLDCDELCDWTRLYRLPKVMRDGEPTDADPNFDIEFDRDARLPISELGEATKKEKMSLYAEVREFTDPQPDEEDARLLIETMVEGKVKPTEWAKTAKKRLINRDCYDTLFNHKKLADRGSRDNTIHQYVGQVVSLLYYVDGTTPAHIYGLFIEPVSQLDDEDGEDWAAILWSSVGRLWAKEEAKAEASRMIAEDIEEAAEEAALDVISGMREWCNAEELYADDDDARLWAESKFIVSSGNSYYIMQHDGYYRPQAYSANMLIPAIRAHIGDLIPTRVPTADGKGMKDVGFNTIVARYVTVVEEVIVQPGVRKGHVENLDGTDARLIVPGFHRNPNLTPEFSEDVDSWLKKLFGDEVDDACRWIAFALAFEEGATCSLSIMGAQGCGKKLLVQGLAECLSAPHIASDQDITGSYQYGILKSPFLVVNEGWSAGGYGSKHPADRFRELTSGDSIEVNRRYRDPVTIKNPLRVIFTANNLDVIKMLAHKRDLSQTDREALAIRLMHFNVGRNASDWLRMKGGMRFTGAQGKRWIAPDAGGKSDFIVAKHFLWLFANRHQLWERDERLLVEGQGSQELMFEMQTQTGTAPLVIETILSMMDRKIKTDGLIIDNKTVYLLSAAIVNHWRERMSQNIRGENLTTNSVAKVLGGLCMEESPKARVLPNYPDEGRRRWFELDVSKIKEAADRHGFLSKKLNEVVAARNPTKYEERL